MKKKLLAALLAAAMLTGLASATFAAGEGEERSIEIIADKTEITANDSDSVTLTAKVMEGTNDTTDNVIVKWGASNAIISSPTGRQITVKVDLENVADTIRVTAWVDGFNMVETTIKVNPDTAPPSDDPNKGKVDINITGSYRTVKPGSTVQLTPDITLEDGSKYEGNVIWKIEPAVEGISIDENGKLTVASTVPEDTEFWVDLSIGRAGTSMRFNVASVFDPNAPDFQSVGITEPASHDIVPGTSIQLTPNVTLSDGSRYQGNVIWKIDPAVEGVAIDENGRVTVARTVLVGTKFWVRMSVAAKDRLLTGACLFFVVEPSNSSSSEGSSSGGSGETAAAAPAPTEEKVSAVQAAQKAEQAIAAAEKADPDASQVVVKVRNVKSITAAALKAVAKTAEKAEKASIVHADVVKDGKVESRLYIDPALVKGNEDIQLGVTLGDEKVSGKFDKYFKNDIAVVKFDQAGSFGMPIQAAVKLDLSGMDTKALIFYSYDPKTNTYTRIAAPNYRLDRNGYLHFTTSVGNCVIVTDEPLARK